MEGIKSKVTNDLTVLILLRIIPGNEGTLYQEIRRYMKKCHINIGIFKGFGRFDIIIILETDSLKLINKFRKEIIKHIHEFYPLICFKWTSHKNKNIKSDFLNYNQKIYGISLIKLNLNSFPSQGIQSEINLVNHFLNINDLYVLGGIGYHEIIIIFSSEDFNEFEIKLEEIEKTIHKAGNICLDKTTIPIFNYNWIFELISKENISNSQGNHIDIITFLSLNSGYLTEKVLKEINKFDKNFSITFGYHDFILQKSENVNHILNNILKLRKNLSKINYFPSSFTLIKRKKPFSASDIEQQLEFKLKQEELIKIKDEQESLTKYLVHIYNQIMQNPFTEKIFLNSLNKFFTEFLPNLRKQKIEYKKNNDFFGYRSKIIEYNMLIKVLTYTFIQRLSGINLGDLLASNLLNFENYGSINRLILALESFPKFFFNLSGLKFNGFCCIGFDDRYCSYSGNIYNIPRNILFKIEEWWGILHEIFHSLEEQIGTGNKVSFLKLKPDLKREFDNIHNDLLMERFKIFVNELNKWIELKDNVLNEDNIELKIFHPWFQSVHGHYENNFIYETVPSVLDFFIAWCPDKRELYYEKLGQYLSKDFSLNSNEYYLARLAFVKLFEIYYYKEEFKDANQSYSFEELEKHLEKFFQDLEKKLNIKIFEEIKERAKFVTLIYQNIAKFYVRWLKTINTIKYNIQVKDEIKKNLTKGIIDASLVYTPLDILHSILELEEEDKLSNICRISAFLYLYNFRIRNKLY